MSDWDWPRLHKETLLLEDSEIIALNKPTDISVTGEYQDDDIVSLAKQAGEELFPVHRIDKVTTGVVLFAKNLKTHGYLTRQFNKRTVRKQYLIITKNIGLPDEGTIDLPLATGRKGRVRIAGSRESIRWDAKNKCYSLALDTHTKDKKVYPSLSRFKTLWSNEEFSLILAEPSTGRKQQLRVHFAWIGYPILGDPLFDKTQLPNGWQTCLHSWRLEFDADWQKQNRVTIEAPPSASFWRPIERELSEARRAELLEQA